MYQVSYKRRLIFIVNILAVISMITFSNLGFLPIENLIVFGVFSVLIFVLVWYQLDFIFILFIGSIVLENINLAPVELGLSVRLYQLLGGVIFLVTLLKLIFGKLEIKLPKFCWRDGLILIFILSGFISSIFADNQILSLKQSVIIASFGALYFLFRIFIQNLNDLKKVIPFFLSSSFIVVLYGIWQNWQFMRGGSHFEVMPGRPNAVFTEPDWLGMFLVFVVPILYILIFKNFQSIKEFLVKKLNYFYLSFLILTFTLLILTVARSAWLGVGVVTVIYLILTLLNLGSGWKNVFKKLNWKKFFLQSLIIFSTGIIAISLVYFLNLTNFELGNRVQSTGSGKQEITISCILMFSEEQHEFLNSSVKEIENVKELEKYNCRHINLQEIKREESKGNLVTRVYRNDPNVNVRAEVYRKSWQEIKNNWFFGIGWGNIGSILGTDEAGTTLNSSNIFLEIWLGAGILGIVSFLILIIGVLWRGLTCLFKGGDSKNKSLGIFLILGIVAIIIPNMFNAGVMLGYLWLFFEVSKVDSF